MRSQRPIRSHWHRWIALAAGGLLLLVSGRVLAQTTYTWNVAGPGNWTTAANWTPTRTTPAANDILRIDGAVTATPTLNNVITQQIGELQIVNGASAQLTANPPNPVTLTITGGTGTDLDIASGSLVIANSPVLTIALNPTATGVVIGNVTVQNAAHRIISNAVSGLVFGAGSVVTAGAGFTGSLFGNGVSNSVEFQNGSTYVSAAGSAPFAKTSPSSVVVFETGSLYKHTQTAAPDLAGRTYGNFELNAPGHNSTNTGSSTFSVDGLAITAGTLHLRLTQIHIRGNVSVAPAGNLIFDPSGAQSLLFNGSSAQTIGNTGPLTFNSNAAVTVGNPVGVTLLTPMGFQGLVTVSSGSILAVRALVSNMGSFHVDGIFQVESGGTSQGSSFIYGSNSTLVFNNASPMTYSGAGYWSSPAPPPNVTMQNGGGVLLQTPAPAITGTLNLVAGVLSCGPAPLVIAPGGSVTGGNASSFVNGTLVKTLPASGSPQNMTFEIGAGSFYAPISFGFPSVPVSGTVQCATYPGDHVDIVNSGVDPDHSVNRVWEVASNATFAPCTATFQFDPAEVDAGADPATFVARKFDSPGGWTAPWLGTRTATTTQATGIASFSQFQIGNLLSCDSPAIVQGPAPACVASNSTVDLTVVASGTEPRMITWRHDGADVPLGGHFSLVGENLRIDSFGPSDQGSYDCVITNPCGTVSSAPALVQLTPALTTQPVSQYIAVGQTAAFSVTSTSFTPLAIQWYKGQTALSDGGHVSGAHSATLTVTSAAGEDAGNYRTALTGDCGTLWTQTVQLSFCAAAAAPVYLSQWDEFPAGTALAFHPAGFIFEATGSQIRKYTRDGSLLLQWTLPLADDGRPARPSDIAVGLDGNLLIADLPPMNSNAYALGGRVFKYSPDGTLLATWRHADYGDPQILLFPTAIDVDSQGRIFVLNSDIQNNFASGDMTEEVQVFQPDGQFAARFGSGILFFTTSLAIDQFGSIYVGRYSTSVVKFDAQFQYLGVPSGFSISDGNTGFYDIEAGVDGRIYGSLWLGGNIVYQLSEGNSPVVVAPPGGGPGQVTNPTGVAIDDRGDVFVQSSNKIQRFGCPNAPPPFTDIGAGLSGAAFGMGSWGDYDGDGDLDVLISGSNPALTTTLYRNDAGTFTDVGAGLPGLHFADAAWGDYDNDGDLDLLLSGNSGGGPMSRVYRNDAGTFVDAGAGLLGMFNGSTAWGDYDNDGDLDILLTGFDGTQPQARVYRNDAGTFTDIAAAIPGVHGSAAAWGDYDNDGDLDIALTGLTGGDARVSEIYRNDAGAFTALGAGLSPVYTSTVEWGDYDGDGDLDLLLAGSPAAGGIESRIYRNQAGVFVDIGALLQGVSYAAADWGDFDNDGDRDLVVAGGPVPGNEIRVYRNNNGNFVDIGAGLPGIDVGSVRWGDCDNDGDLDLLAVGSSASGPVAVIYRNGVSTPNTLPATPSGLLAQRTGNVVTFSWNAASDAQTPASSLTYNLRVGTSSGGSQISSPMAGPATGYRRVVRIGNAGHRLSQNVTVPTPPDAPLYWSVQSIDGGHAGSPFATEHVVAPLATDCTGVPQALVSWWKFDGNARDVTGRNDGTIVGSGAQFPAAEVGSGFLRGPVENYIEVPPSASLNITHMTLDAWVRPDAFPGTPNIAWKSNNGYDPTSPFGMGLAGTSYPPSEIGKAFFMVGNGVTRDLVYSTTPLPAGVFTHIAGTADGTTVRLYLNGVLNNQVPQTVIPFTNSIPLYIGGWPNGNPFVGVIDEMELHRVALSAAQINRIYQAGAFGKCLSIQATGGSGTFGPRTNVTAGTFPSDAVLHDVSGDGILDLVVANRASGTVSLQFGSGNGSFAPQPDLVPPSAPFALAAGDLNDDGRADLAMTTASNTVIVMLGTGGGSFAAPVEFPAGARPSSIAIGDFDNDGKQDLVCTNRSDATVSVFAGDGAGGFASAADYPVTDGPEAVAAGDLNGDGWLDIIVAHSASSTLSVLLNVAGGFAAPVPYTTADGLSGVAIADLNADGNLDVAASSFNVNTAVVWLGDGSGGLGGNTDFTAGSGPQGIAIADLNGDGRPDLITASEVGSASVLLNNGSGVFHSHVEWPAGFQPFRVAAGDVNGDGVLDLAVSNRGDGTVSIIPGLGGFVLPPGVTHLATGDSQSYAIAPAAGFVIGNVWVDGASQGPITSYSFNSVSGDHRIDVEFALEATDVAGDAAPPSFRIESVRASAGGFGVRIAYSLIDAGNARLDWFDVAGRRVASASVPQAGSGRHVLELAAPHRVASGLYWVRLTQGPETAVARVAIRR